MRHPERDPEPLIDKIMRYLSSIFFRVSSGVCCAAWIVLLQACPGPKDPNPIDTSVKLTPGKSTVSQLELVQLIVKDARLSVKNITGMFGDKSVNLIVAGDTLTFLVPDVPAGQTTLSFKDGQKDFKAAYTVQEVKLTSSEGKIGEFTVKVDAQIATLEQTLKISKIPANGVLNTAEISELKKSAVKFKEDIGKATSAEKKELAKFLTANPVLEESLAAGSMGASGRFSDSFLAAVKALLSEAGVKAIVSGSAGYIFATAGVGPVGWLIGAALLINAVLTIKKAMYKIVELSHLGAESGDLLDPIWSNRMAARTVERDRPYKVFLQVQYRTLGKQDASNASFQELFSFNDKLYYFADKLKTLKMLSGDIVNLRNLESQKIQVTVPAKDVVASISGNAGVSIANSVINGDTLLLTFKSASEKDEAFALNLSYKSPEGQTLSKSEGMILHAPVLDAIVILQNL